MTSAAFSDGVGRSEAFCRDVAMMCLKIEGNVRAALKLVCCLCKLRLHRLGSGIIVSMEKQGKAKNQDLAVLARTSAEDPISHPVLQASLSAQIPLPLSSRPYRA